LDFTLWTITPLATSCCRQLAVALVSPLEALDDRLLITHMLQHLLLLMIAPPLLLLGAPQIPLIRALPPSIAKRTVGVIAKSRACRRCFSFVTHPASAFLLFSVAMLGWHLPGPFESALHSDYRHAAEHACFIVAGTLFWYPIVRPWPAIERWSRLAFVPYMLIADAENSMLAAFLVFSGRVLYPSYANLPRFGGSQDALPVRTRAHRSPQTSINDRTLPSTGASKALLGLEADLPRWRCPQMWRCGRGRFLTITSSWPLLYTRGFECRRISPQRPNRSD
jgi:hypothetical protein